MNLSTSIRLIGCAVAATLVGVLGSAAQARDAAPRADAVQLANGVLREAVAAFGRGDALPSEVSVEGDSIRVEILPARGADLPRAVAAVGGRLEGTVGDVLAQALVPIGRLVELEARRDVAFLRPPLRVDVPVAASSGPAAARIRAALAEFKGEEVTETKADVWHAQGFKGAGVKVAIIDSFSGDLWQQARNQVPPEVPDPAGQFCRDSNSNPCDVFNHPDGPSNHGVGVAEIVYEMAPNAQLYLVSVDHPVDLQKAVDWLSAQGVQIITRSETAEYDGPGDGTGPIATVIESAVSQGIVWFNSAGNNAGREDKQPGSYWRGGWTDVDGDGWLDFAFGDERLDFICGFVNGLRWSDWGSANPTDYELAFFDNAGDQVPERTSENRQGPGVPPLEHVEANCENEGDEQLPYDYLGIRLLAANDGASGDVLEFMTNGLPVEYSQNPYSASGPGADTKSPGALAIGAIDPPKDDTIAWYSAWGPTNDQRVKPDLTAPACVTNFSFRDRGCFPGTSAATPVAAGAAALVIGAGAAVTPAAVKTYLLTSAAQDRGDPGPDNLYGAGQLILPAPPTCTKSWTGPDGNWSQANRWNPGGVPTANDVVCIDANGTYTVTVSDSRAAKALRIGGSTGTQTLKLSASCSGDASLFLSDAVKNGTRGQIELTSSGCANAATLNAGQEAITNLGGLTASAGAGGARSLTGGLLNQGVVTIANGTELAVSGSVTNALVGSLATGTSGKLVVSNGAFTHAGAITGLSPFQVELRFADLSIATDSASGRFLWHGSGQLSGRVKAGQLVQLDGSCDHGNAGLTVAPEYTDPGKLADFANAGAIVLTSSCDRAAVLNMNGRTLDNQGALQAFAGAGGVRSITGKVVNGGSLQVSQPLTLTGDLTNTGTVAAGQALSYTGVWENRGALTISDGVEVSANGTFVNAAQGSIATGATGRLVVSNGAFTHAGSITGASPFQVELRHADLSLVGSGLGRFLWHGFGNLSGNVAAAQLLQLDGSCTYSNANAIVGADFSNAGTIVLTSDCDRAVVLSLNGKTLTNKNKGLLQVRAGAGGSRSLGAGRLVNQKTLDLGAGTTLDLTGDYTQSTSGIFKTALDSLTSFGALNVSGTASLKGGLTIVRKASFDPAAGSQLDVLTASGGPSGSWTKVAGAVIKNQKYFLPTYLPDAAALVVRVAAVALDPAGGPPGTRVTLNGSGFPPTTDVTLKFKDSAGKVTSYPRAAVGGNGSFSVQRDVPGGAAPGPGKFTAKSTLTGVVVNATFTVT
jgi:hypothetical protein